MSGEETFVERCAPGCSLRTRDQGAGSSERARSDQGVGLPAWLCTEAPDACGRRGNGAAGSPKEEESAQHLRLEAWCTPGTDQLGTASGEGGTVGFKRRRRDQADRESLQDCPREGLARPKPLGSATNLKGGAPKRARKQTLVVDAGQKQYLTTICSVCEMVYSPGDPEDEQLHREFHNRHVAERVPWPARPGERVVRREGAHSRVVVVRPGDAACDAAHVRSLFKAAESSCGLTNDGPRSDAQPTVVAEVVRGHASAAVFVERLRPEDDASVWGEATPASSTSRPLVGVVGVYLAAGRDGAAAAALVDRARAHVVHAYDVQRSQVAFLGPLGPGGPVARLATECMARWAAGSVWTYVRRSHVAADDGCSQRVAD